MQQAWLNVVGVGLDIVGFWILAWEWSRGFMQEWGERHRGDQLLGRSFLGARDDGTYAEFRKQATDAQMKVRAWWFFTGVATVLSGFVLQLLGSWPGGIPAIGIVL